MHLEPLESRTLLSVSHPLSDIGLTASLPVPLPSSLVIGQRFHIAETTIITDTSGSAISEPVHGELFFSTANSINGDSIEVDAGTADVHLKPGGKRVVHGTLRSLPSSITPGTYCEVIELTDPQGDVTEAASSNTVTLQAPQIDLAAALSKTPVSAKPGARTSVAVTVSDSGNIDASGSLPIDLDVSPDGLTDDLTRIGTVTKKVNIRPGKSVKIAVNGIAPAAGSWYLVVQVDPMNTFDDVNPANNTIVSSGKITVS